MAKRCLPFLMFLFTLVGCLSPPLSGQAVSDDEAVRASGVSEAQDTPSGKALFHYARARLLALDNHLPEAAQALQKGIELDPHSVYLRMVMAQLQLALGNEKLARRALEDALIHNPDAIEAQLMLGNLLLNAKAYRAAVGVLQRVVALDPSLEQVYLKLALAYMRLEDTDGAIDILKALLAHDPDSKAGGLALARLYRELGLTSLAEEAYRAYIDKYPGDAHGYVELSRLYKALRRNDAALAVLQRGLAAEQVDDAVRYPLIRAMVEQGGSDAALQALRDMLRQNPERNEARRLLGLLLMDEKQWDAAAKVFGQLLSREPQHEQAQFYLGMIEERRERWPQAIAHFEKITAASELYVDATSHLAYLLYDRGDTDAAIRLLEGRLAQMEGRPQLYTFLAGLYEQSDNDRQAGAWLARGLVRFPDSAQLYYHRGLFKERQKDRDGALKDMRRALELDDKHYEAMNFIAYSFAEQGEHLEEALTLARQALKLNNEGHILDTLGWVLYKMGRYDDARPELEAAAALLSEDPLVLEHLGDLYVKLGLQEKADATYRRALQSQPDNEDLRKKIERLNP